MVPNSTCGKSLPKDVTVTISLEDFACYEIIESQWHIEDQYKQSENVRTQKQLSRI